MLKNSILQNNSIFFFFLVQKYIVLINKSIKKKKGINKISFLKLFIIVFEKIIILFNYFTRLNFSI